MAMKPRIGAFITGLGVAMMLASGAVHARGSFLNSFNSLYGTTGTRLDSCGTCHYDFGGGGPRNFYGEEFANNGNDFAAIEPLDVDNDGVVSIEEINQLFMPGLNCDNISLTSGAPTNIADYADPNNPGCGAANEPPVAVANGPYTGTVGVPVSFTSAGSNDPDGTIAAYLWDFGDGGTSIEPNPTHTYTVAGTYTVSLTVTDDQGATGSDTTTATINEAPVQEPDINLNPASLDFGMVEVGTTEIRTTTVENLGTVDLNVSMISLCDGTSVEYSWSPNAPFTVTPGASQTVTVTYAPVDEGLDAGCLAIASDDPDENPALLNVSGTGFVPQPQVLDLDIAGFRVTKRVSLSSMKPVAIKLVVKNAGMVEGSGDATVVGMQNGMMVYSETMAVTDPVGNGRTTYEFPAYTPAAIGDIMWTATIVDGDPDDDTATAVTRVVP